ncbi:dispatched homolog 1 [Seminavis robusta]|uniref:Dispatched homolog 1 n=1 Tax=Seminavis robusta TaxID=568900 RepID=A0A9N8HLN8_9STRA|nr:dispatched homolog 1 [Seminavis robusta]|eukprot:Sro932_g221640.1 dispatched homolog 1 (1138) ;mRNA; r:20929-24530
MIPEESPVPVTPEERSQAVVALTTTQTCSSSSTNSNCEPSRMDNTTTPQQPQYTLLERTARRVARWPQTHLWTALVVAVVISGLGMYFGNFSVSFEAMGWPSRGTLVSKRDTQYRLVNRNRVALSKRKNQDVWEDLTTNIQCGWEVPDGKCPNDNFKEEEVVAAVEEQSNNSTSTDENSSSSQVEEEQDKQVETSSVSPTSLTELWSQCDVGFYAEPNFYLKSRLWPVWKVTDPAASALDPALLQTICEAEEQTQAILHREGLCFGCNNGQCLPPMSLVLYARFTVRNGMAMTCPELAQAWAPHQAETVHEFQQCVRHLRGVTDFFNVQDRGPCPTMFSPAMVDKWFDQTGRVTTTSSVFMSKNKKANAKKLYAVLDEFGRGNDTSKMEVAYDNQHQMFVEFYSLDAIPYDMTLMCASAVITTAAMMFHTRSPFLTFIGIFQISLSFPLAYTIYRFAGGITFFPFLNLVGVFVAFALGADHVFVAVDKWKNERIDHPHASTEDVAAKALPGAGRAMVLTTTTTAIAFFGTGICPVLPVKLFGIFCGLLIAVDYILDCLVMFPCLCIYDSYRSQRNYCMDIRCSKVATSGNDDEEPNNNNRRAVEEDYMEGEEEKMEEEDQVQLAKEAAKANDNNSASVETPLNNSLIRRLLTSYYNCLHRWNYAILGVSIVGLGVCAYFATTLKPPESTGSIQILIDSVEHEKARVWRPELLFDTLMSSAGGGAAVIFGVIPADTGNHLDPYEWSQLVLDDSFDPSPKAAQVYMRDYCAIFFSQEFASPHGGYIDCAINEFDGWLQEQSSLPLDYQNETYTEHCNGSAAMPLEEDVFHPCLSGWAQQERERTILAWDGIVKVIFFGYKSRVRFDSPNKLLGEEWRLVEDWMEQDSENAPDGVGSPFSTALDYLAWDTNAAVYQTALGSGAIAILVSALVILISSKSLSLTVFSAISVAFVLLSVAAVMSAAQWTLGFLESVCFTILIGLSADFVLHFSHAYCELPGDTDRHTRTKHALIHLGPSILAAGFTTLAGAAIMLFTVIYFWRLFAMVLFFTIIQATIGSFVVFLVFTDVMGPSNPTYLVDNLTRLFWIQAAKCTAFFQQQLQTEAHTAPKSAPQSTMDGEDDHDSVRSLPGLDSLQSSYSV